MVRVSIRGWGIPDVLTESVCEFCQAAFVRADF